MSNISECLTYSYLVFVYKKKHLFVFCGWTCRGPEKTRPRKNIFLFLSKSTSFRKPTYPISKHGYISRTPFQHNEHASTSAGNTRSTRNILDRSGAKFRSRGTSAGLHTSGGDARRTAPIRQNKRAEGSGKKKNGDTGQARTSLKDKIRCGNGTRFPCMGRPNRKNVFVRRQLRKERHRFTIKRRLRLVRCCA